MHSEEKWRLKKEVSVVDAAAASTTLGIFLSGIYNLGFFSATEGNLATVLSVQDLLMGAAAVAAPGIVVYFVGYTAPRLWPSNPGVAQAPDGFWSLIAHAAKGAPVRNIPVWARKFLFCIAVFLSISALVWQQTGRTYLPELQPLAYLVAGVVWLFLAACNSAPKILIYSIIAVFSFTATYSLGRSNYFSAIDGTLRTLSTVQTDARSISGLLVRVTSANVFIYKDERLEIIPSAIVKSISTDAGKTDPVTRYAQQVLAEQSAALPSKEAN